MWKYLGRYHYLAGDPMTNTQSTLPTATGLCQNVSLAVLFDSNTNSDTVSTHPDMCMCIYTYILQNRDAGGAKEIIKHWPAVNAASQGNLSARHRFASSVVRHRLQFTQKRDGWHMNRSSIPSPSSTWTRSLLFYKSNRPNVWDHPASYTSKCRRFFPRE